jgi:bla regulator protein blaR1
VKELTDALLRSSLQGGFLIVAVGVLLWALPKIPARIRVWFWRLALLKLVLGLVLPISIVAGLAIPGGESDHGSWLPMLISGLWFLGVALLTGTLTAEWVRASQLKLTSNPYPGAALAKVHRVVRHFAPTSIPPIRLSDEIDTPVLVGAGKAMILLPWGEPDPDGQVVAIAHELTHYSRGDLSWAWLTCLANTLFFFHPLAHWAVHELRACEEAACDQMAIEASGVSSAEYGARLLRMSTLRSDASSSPVMAGMGSAGARLRRRLRMLGAPTTASPLAYFTLFVVVAAAVPTYRTQPEQFPLPGSSPVPVMESRNGGVRMVAMTKLGRRAPAQESIKENHR